VTGNDLDGDGDVAKTGGWVPPTQRAGQKRNSFVTPASGIMTASQVRENTKGKLGEIFAAGKKNGAAVLADLEPDKYLDPVELNFRFSQFELQELLEETTEFSTFQTKQHGVVTLPELLTKLNTKNSGTISLGQLVDSVVNPARVEQKKEGRKRFNTWGRKKKKKELDKEFGMGPGADGEGGGLESKRNMFLY
jgi:hypothetical protein